VKAGKGGGGGGGAAAASILVVKKSQSIRDLGQQSRRAQRHRDGRRHHARHCPPRSALHGKPNIFTTLARH